MLGRYPVKASNTFLICQVPCLIVSGGRTENTANDNNAITKNREHISYSNSWVKIKKSLLASFLTCIKVNATNVKIMGLKKSGKECERIWLKKKMFKVQQTARTSNITQHNADTKLFLTLCTAWS